MNPLATKDLNVIGPIDLQDLLDSHVEESLTLEFKSELWPDTPGGKKEMLKDVSGLANGNGGDIIVGAMDKDDCLIGFRPVPDAEDRADWLMKVCRDGISPRLPIHARTISLPGGGDGVVVRVPSGIRKPYCVVLDKGCRVWRRYRPHETRAPTGEEVHEMAVQSEGLAQQARALLEVRTKEILASQPDGALFFQAAPLAPAEDTIDTENPALRDKLYRLRMTPDSGNWEIRFNRSRRVTIEGIRLPDERDYPTARYVLELWRTGYVELVIRMDRLTQQRDEGAPLVWVRAPSTAAMRFATLLVDLHSHFSLPTPLVLAAGWCGTRSVALMNHPGGGGPTFASDAVRASADVLLTPPRVLHELATPDPIAEEIVGRLLRGFGVERNPMFRDGRWAGG